MKIYIYLILLLFLAKCQSPNKKENVNTISKKKPIQKNEMVEDSIISFLLDKQTNPYFRSADYDFKNKVFSFINVKNSNFYIYEDSVNFIKTKLSLTGPNGLGNLMLVKHKYVSHDSILMYHANKLKLFLVNSKGKIKRKYSLRNKDLYAPYYSQITPIQTKGNSVFFPITRENHFFKMSANKSVLEVNLKDNSLKYHIKYPKVYDKKFWGSQFKYENSIALKGNTLHVLYPISDTVQTKNIKTGQEENYLAKSQYIDDFKYFREIETKEDLKNHDFIAEKNFSLSQSDHTAILYHDTLNLFFVINYLRPDLENVRKDYKIPDFSVAFFDEKFQKLGERKFKSKKYFHTLIFKHKKGLMIGRRDLYRKNENKLTFSIFEIKDTL